VEKRVILILSIVILGLVNPTVTGVVRLLDTFSPDECGKDLCLTVKTDQEIYALRDTLRVDVFLSNNGVKQYKGLPSALDMEIYNASQALMVSRSTYIPGRRLTLARGTKTRLNAPLHTYLGTHTFHPGIFTIIVTVHHPEYVLEGNTTFTIRE
jgi:hypothetical protein